MYVLIQYHIYIYIYISCTRYTPWRHIGERMCSSYSYLTSALDGISGQRQAPAALYPFRYPVDKRLGGPQSRSGRRGWKKNPFTLPGIEPRSSSPTLYCLSYRGSIYIYILCVCVRARVCVCVCERETIPKTYQRLGPPIPLECTGE
jgi:hypothetical protein